MCLLDPGNPSRLKWGNGLGMFGKRLGLGPVQYQACIGSSFINIDHVMLCFGEAVHVVALAKAFVANVGAPSWGVPFVGLERALNDRF